jgi:hypothetical protein
MDQLETMGVERFDIGVKRADGTDDPARRVERQAGAEVGAVAAA